MIPVDPPPHNLEAEQAVLGSMLLDRDAVAGAVEALRPDDFYRDAHRVIFEAMGELFRRGEPVDLIMVTNRLTVMNKIDDVGGATYLASLPNAIPTAANVDHYANLVREKAMLRAALTAGERIVAAASASVEVSALDELLHSALAGLASRRNGDGGNAVLRRLADVTPMPVRWLWPGRVPLGKVTVLDGDPGLGKSLITIDLAARVTRGRAMPDETPSDLDGPRGVVVLSAEDDVADTIRPRLDAAGADVELVALLEAVRDPQGERGPTIADIGAIEEAIGRTGAALVIVDPLMAYLPDERDSHRDHDIRRALRPLAALAARTGVAIVVIRHLSKTPVGNPLYRGGGSIGIIGAARSGLLVAPDPDDQSGGRRILAVTKANLAASAPALAYHVVAVDGVPGIVWEGMTEHTAETLLAARVPDDERSAVDEAVDFLIGELAAGAKPAAEVKSAARSAGISERTLERARAKAGVTFRRQGFGGPFVWSLHPRQNSHTRQPLGNGEYGLDGEHEGIGGQDKAREDGPNDSRLDVPPSPNDLTTRALRDRARVTVEILARSFGWPATEFAPGQTILSGELSWRRFLQRASSDQLARAIVRLEASEERV